jgi:hypothetical protein
VKAEVIRWGKVLQETGLAGSEAFAKATERTAQRPDCLAGHVGLELRNVVANYRFEKPHRFPEIQPNSGHGDHSRLSCDGGDTQLGPRVNFTRCW